MEEKSQGEREREWPRDEKEEAWVVVGVRWPEKMEVLAPWTKKREKKEGGREEPSRDHMAFMGWSQI